MTTTNQTLNRADSGSLLMIGGELRVLTGGTITPNSGTQATVISAAETSHALNATFSDTEVEAALNALGTKFNSLLAAIKAVGIVASS